jgi:hypothetical protein
MRKFLTICAILLSLSASAQWQQTGSRVRYVNGIGIPTRDTSAMTPADSSQILIRPADSSLYVRYKRAWQKVGAGGGGISGSGTINRVPKWTSSSALGNSSIVDSASSVAMTINPSGNVGISTPSPEVKLESNISSSGLPATTGTTQSNGTFRNSSTSTSLILDFGLSGSGTAASWIQSTDRLNLSTNYNLLLNPNGGNVGIGYTAPAARLAVNGTTLINTNTDNGVDRLQVSGSATISDDLKVQGGDILITSPTAVAQFRVQGLSVPTGFDVQSFMTGGTPEAYLWQRDNGPFYFGTNNTERLKITGGGDIGIGTGPSNPSSKLHVNGGTLIVSNSGVTGSQVNIGIGLLTAARPFIGTNTSSNPLEIGTRDAQSTILVTNSIERVRIVSGGAVLVNTTTDNGVDQLQVNGSIQGTGFDQAYTARTTTYTAATTDYFIDCTSGTFTVNLFTAVGNTGRILIIKNSGTGTITVDPNGSQTIDGATTQTLSTQWSRVHIISDGANWKIISN